MSGKTCPERHFIGSFGAGRSRSPLFVHAVSVVNRWLGECPYRKRDGSRIIAQCKKDPNPRYIESEFLNLSENFTVTIRCAYGGCSDEAHGDIRIIDRAFALRWADRKWNAL
jgi:hypothetical protein